MKKYIFIILSVCFIFLPVLVQASPPLTESVNLTTNKYILENGLTVLITEMPASSVVSVYLLVKAGSANEGKFLGSGITHFLEHMLFKGTETRGVGDISKEIQAIGGVINASTGFDYTIYTITVPADGFNTALDILADMMQNSQFAPQELKKEREVVYNEMKMHKARPKRYLMEMVFDTVYKRHPYRLPVIGHEALLRKLTREDFLEYYRKYYSPNNMVLAVAGKIDRADAVTKIKNVYHSFERQSAVSRILPQEPRQIAPRRYEETYPTDLTRMSLVYASMSISDPDLYALDALSMILGSGKSSRLYLDLYKKKGLVHSISASNFTPIDRGGFEVECVLDEENVEETIATVKEQIALVKKKGVASDELDKVKRRIYRYYVSSMKTTGSVARKTAIDEAVAGDYDFSRVYVENINKVTNADIKRVARKYLIDTGLSVVVLRPESESQEGGETATHETVGQIEKVVLENGLTILFRENHTLPAVSVVLALNGGTRYEPQELNGISALTANMWVKGTKSCTANEIASQVESMGASLNGFSGRNSLGLTLEVLSEDLKTGLDLLEDILKNPVFPDDELAKDKELTKTAIIAKKDSIEATTAKELRQTLFQTHPFRLETSGTLDSVDRVTREDVKDFYKKMVVPGSMVLTVLGDFDKEALLEELTGRFGTLSAGAVPAVHHEEPLPEAARQKEIDFDKDQAMVMIGFRGVDFLHEDRYALNVLASIMGSSFSGRMFSRIREEFGRAYALSGVSLPGKDAGMVYFYVLTVKESVDEVRVLLQELLQEIQEQEVSDSELANMKAYMKGRFQMRLETDSSVAFMVALDELYGLGHDHYKMYSKNIDAVTVQDVRRAAKKYLNMGHAAIVVARPQTKE
ncbi:MAG: insulinase family protein [Candidatus Omnitrophica bacterium]|nr:insulinase family protein [Candidatus Omnitrophota bacterium]